jgi:hypothetical protein
MPFLRKYAVLTVTGTTAIRIPMVKRAVVDFAVSADWTPAAGDVKIAVDGAAPTNVANLPTAVASGNGAYWEFILTAAELTCKQAIVTVVDSATKAVEDQAFLVETYGNASAMYQADLSAANLPANAVQVNGTAQTARDLGATLGVAGAGLTALGDARIANLDAAISTRTKPADTQAAVTLVATTTALTNAPTAGDLTAAMKASVTTAATAATPIAASVTGAVGSVTGAVGSVTGNVGGNVVGTVASVVGSIGSIVNAGIDLIFDRAAGVETNYTVRQALRLILSAVSGKLSGAATATILVRDLNDTKNRITATVDGSGNRSAITTDVS